MNVVPILALAGLMIGLSKGGLGGPVPVALVAPLLSTIMPVNRAIGVTLPLLLFADIFALRIYWDKWDIAYIRLMMPMGVIGVIMGTLLLATLSNTDLKHVLGTLTLIAVIYKLASESLNSLKYSPRRWHGYLAGWASGFGSALANVGAPPFTAYMLLQKVSPTVFIGTTTLFFAVVNALKLPGFLSTQVIDIDQLLSILWVLPIIPFGVWIGRKVLGWISPKMFEWLMICLLLWSSLALLFSNS